MAINVVSVLQYNGGFLPGIIPMLLPSGNPFKCHEEVSYLPPMRLNVLTFPPLTGGCSEGLNAFKIVFKAALYTIVPRSPFFSFVLQNIAGYKNAVECLLQ